MLNEGWWNITKTYVDAAILPAHITTGLCELCRVPYITAPRHIGGKMRRLS